jgi:hypothetical protein
MTRDNQSTDHDERLAAFANQVLDGEVNDPSTLSAIGPDPEMRALAETILRLSRAFPNEGPDPASAKRIRARVVSRWRDERQKKARWFKFLRPEWLIQFRRPQFVVAVAMVAVIGFLFVVIPYLSASGDPITGTAGAGSSLNIITWIILGILVVLTAWLLRRKS